MKYFFSVKPDEIAVKVAHQARQVVETVDNPEDADIIAAVGGDGSLIHTVYHYHRYKKPFVGINGGSEGAHCLIRRSKLSEGFEAVSHITPIAISFIEAKFDGKTELASQDVRLERRTGQAIRVKIRLDGRVVSHRHAGDGIMVSNALGSTGYNRSAGGGVLPITSGNLILTPVCPTYSEVAFDNLMKPMVFTREVVEVTPEDGLCLVIDNRDYFIEGGTTVRIKQSGKTFRFYPREVR